MMSFMRGVFSTRNTLVMTITLTTVHFAFGLYLDFFPLYMRELGASVEIIGLLNTVFGFVRLLTSFPGGMLADWFGRKKLILFGTAMRAITVLLYLFASTWQQLIPGLIANTLSFYGPSSYAIVLESLPAERRTTSFGAIQTVVILCSSFTSAIGGLVIDTVGLVGGMRLLLTAIVITLTGVFLVRYKFLSETLKTQKLARRPSFSPRGLGVKGSVLAMLVTQCLFWIAFRLTLMGPFLVLYATDVMGFSATQWGVIQMVFRAVFAIASVPGGMFADRFGKRLAVFLSLAIGTIPIFGYIVLRDFNAILALNVLAGLGAAFGGPIYGGGPAWQTLRAELIPTERLGQVLGLFGTISGLVAAPFPYVGGYIWDTFSPSMMMLIAGVFSVTSTINFLMFVKESKSVKQAN